MPAFLREGLVRSSPLPRERRRSVQEPIRSTGLPLGAARRARSGADWTLSTHLRMVGGLDRDWSGQFCHLRAAGVVGSGAALAFLGFTRGWCFIRCWCPRPLGVVGGCVGWECSPFPRHFCVVVPSGMASQPVTSSHPRYGGSHDLLERWRILGAYRAGRDWFSPSGAALGSDESSVNPPCVDKPPELKAQTSEHRLGGTDGLSI